MVKSHKKISRKDVLRVIKNISLIVFGCALLAFGDAAFIAPLNLVTGGVLSAGVIVQHFVRLAGSDFNVVDIVTWILQIILLIISFIFLGKKFTLRTIFSTLLYPLLLTLFMRVPLAEGLSLGGLISRQFTKEIIVNAELVEGVLVVTQGESMALTLLGGIIGGFCVGAGVAVTYHGDSSTGGLDVISVIIAKHSSIKEAASALALDGTLVIIGMICTRDIPHGFIGILSAVVCALAVQVIFVNMNSFVIADIISSETEAIKKYVEEELDRTTTLIEATGGYTGKKRLMLRVCLSRRELFRFKEFIAEVDPRAFVTFSMAAKINGEGFDPLVKPKNLSEIVSPDLIPHTEEGEGDGK